MLRILEDKEGSSHRQSLEKAFQAEGTRYARTGRESVGTIWSVEREVLEREEFGMLGRGGFTWGLPSHGKKFGIVLSTKQSL